MSTLIITGASSFLGRALLAGLSANRFSELRLLFHNRPASDSLPGRQMTPVRGDLLDRESLRDLITPGATVVHLAYLATARPEEDNVAAAQNLLAACEKAGIRRLIHCSTAVVAGNVPDAVVTEATECRPASGYEAAKLAVERVLQSHGCRFEATVLRPTAVFGPGGKNLIKLARDLAQRAAVVNYVKSCLQGQRRMNLVHIDNVTAALAFLIDAPRGVDGEVFIISDDESPLNNYRDVEQILARGLGVKDYPLPPVALPRPALSAALRMLGRSNTNPQRIYDGSKLLRAGLKKPVLFEQGLATFVSWYRPSACSNDRDQQ